MDFEWILSGSWVDGGWILGGFQVDLGDVEKYLKMCRPRNRQLPRIAARGATERCGIRGVFVVRFGRIAAQSRADRPTKCFPDASLRLLLAHAFEASRRLQLVRSYE